MGNDARANETLDDIEALYRSGYPRYVRLAASIVGDPEGAHDAVQDAFASAIRHRHEYRGSGSLEGWLWRTVSNTALNHRRRRSVPGGSHEPATDRGSPAQTDDEIVRGLVAGLPDRQRHVLFLRYYADLDYRTIAEVLTVKPGTVAAALNAAHATLRAGFVEAGRPPEATP